MKKMLVIHHNDDDGVAAAGVMGYEYGSEYEIDYLEADYTTPLNTIVQRAPFDINEYSRVALVDYSISTERNARFIINHMKGTRTDDYDLIWIDHHKSSIDTIKKYPILSQITGVRMIGMSASLLAFLVYNPSEIFYEIMGNRNDTYDSITIEEMDSIILEYISDEHCAIPTTLLHVNAYDIWDHRNPNVKLFHYGYDIKTPQDFIKILKDDSYDTQVYSNSIYAGKIILDYVNRRNKEAVDDYGFEFCIKYNGRDLKAFALNTTERTSLTFGEKMKVYDVCVPFSYNGKTDKWVYSIYTEKDDIDCSIIAKNYGGGGHQQAAGFSSDELWIFPDTILFIYYL